MSDQDVVDPNAGAQPEPEDPPVTQSSTEPNADGGQPAPKTPPIAAGGKEPEPAPAEKPYWAEDWRTKVAEHAAAGDKKAFEREMKRLERFSDPTAIYGMYRELEGKFSEGGLIKKPGKDATEDEVKAFHKAMGVHEDPKAYVENLTLPDGVQLGDQDKVLAGDFASEMHSAGLTQDQMDKAMAWYFKNEEARAAHIDAEDDKNRTEAMRALKEEYGATLQRNTNAISTLFAMAPGGVDAENEGSLFNRLLAGRMADGKIIGDDPDMTRFLITLAKEVNPVATVVDDAGGSGKTIDDELKEIANLRRTDRRAYDKDDKLQERERELIAAQQKQRARVA